MKDEFIFPFLVHPKAVSTRVTRTVLFGKLDCK